MASSIVRSSDPTQRSGASRPREWKQRVQAPHLALVTQIAQDALPGDLHPVILTHVLLDFANQFFFRLRLYSMAQRACPPPCHSAHLPRTAAGRSYRTAAVPQEPRMDPARRAHRAIRLSRGKNV